MYGSRATCEDRSSEGVAHHDNIIIRRVCGRDSHCPVGLVRSCFGDSYGFRSFMPPDTSPAAPPDAVLRCDQPREEPHGRRCSRGVVSSFCLPYSTATLAEWNRAHVPPARMPATAKRISGPISLSHDRHHDSASSRADSHSRWIICCHVPSTGLPSATGTESDGPRSVAWRCEWPLPSCQACS